MAYPTSIFSPASKNTGDTIQAAHVNDLQTEVTAIETDLITGPITLPTQTHLDVSGGSTFAGPVVLSSGVTFGANSTITLPRGNACYLTHSTLVQVGNGAWTGLDWDTETTDSGLHSTSANSSRITFGSTGIWAIGCNVTWNANSSASRLVKINLNDSSGVAGTGATASGWPGSVVPQSLTTIFPVRTTTDYVTVLVYQDTGSTGSVTPLSTVGTLSFWARQLSQ